MCQQVEFFLIINEYGGSHITLYVWIVHQVKKTSKKRVRGGVSPSEVKIQQVNNELFF